MAQPVWVLSVDLQTKTATFQSGMADAAKSARSAFTDIKSGASEMGGAVGGATGSARQAVMLLGDEFGIHLPRGLTTFIASVGPLGAAMEAAFPFVAIALGVTLLLQHLSELRAAGVKLSDDQIRFGTVAQNVFNSLDEKILRTQIRTDELRNDHLAALTHELQLIDRQSLSELAAQFGILAKEADVVFDDIKRHWYSFGVGAAGAKQSAKEFKLQYDAMLAGGDKEGAANLLQSKLERETKVLALLNQAQSASGKKGTGSDEAWAEQLKYNEALNGLKQMNVKYDKDAVTSAQELVSVLQRQEGVQARVNAETKGDQTNAKITYDKQAAAKSSEAARAAAEHAQKMGELTIETERSLGEAALSIKEATVADRLALDTRLADEEYAVQMAGNKRLIDALNRTGDDYNHQLKGLHEKAEELTRQHDVTTAGLTSKAQVAQYREDLQNLEATERQKIEATEQGSAERLAAIDAALKEQRAKNLQETEGYRELLKARVQADREYAAESAKLSAEAGKESADNAQKMGELALAAAKEKQALIDSGRRITIQQRLAEESNAANQDYALKMAALQQEAAALDKGSKDYLNKLREMQDKERQLTQQHENELTTIKSKAEIERNQRILSAETRFNDEIAQGLTQVLMGHKSFASMMDSIGNQVVSGMMQNAAKSAVANDFTKESDAAAAARKAYLAGMEFPFPANIVMGPVLGAAAFAGVMAFQTGTDYVPGFGKGDKVPAMLEPGEGVVPGGVMDGLRSMARDGQMSGGGNHYHAHVNPTYHVQALDSSGMGKILEKHSDTLTKHVQNTLRKMSR